MTFGYEGSAAARVPSDPLQAKLRVSLTGTPP